MIKHSFIEVDGDLMGKPNALAATLEGTQHARIAVYCNSFSEVDLAAAIIRKRGLSFEKLIHPPLPQDLDGLSQRVAKGAIRGVVCSDEVLTEVNTIPFDLIVNFSVPSSTDAYEGRMASPEAKEVISLVGPLDFSAFHFVKKSFSGEILKGELPSLATLAASKITKFKNDLATFTADAETLAFAETIIGDSEAAKCVAYLLAKFNELTELKNSAGAIRHHSSGGERRDRGSDRGGDRGGRRGGFRGDDNRGNSERRGGGRSSGRFSDGAPMAFDDAQPGNEGFAAGQNEVRFYVGKGSAGGFTEGDFKKLLADHTDIGEAHMKRFKARTTYSFVDIDEDVADSLIDQLASANLEEKGLFVKKATTIPALRGQRRGNGNSEHDMPNGHASSGANEGFKASGEDMQNGDSLEENA